MYNLCWFMHCSSFINHLWFKKLIKLFNFWIHSWRTKKRRCWYCTSNRITVFRIYNVQNICFKMDKSLTISDASFKLSPRTCTYIHTENISCGFDSHYVCVFIEYFKGYRAMVLSCKYKKRNLWVLQLIRSNFTRTFNRIWVI